VFTPMPLAPSLLHGHGPLPSALVSTGADVGTPMTPPSPSLPLKLVISENLIFGRRSDTWRMEKTFEFNCPAHRVGCGNVASVVKT